MIPIGTVTAKERAKVDWRDLDEFGRVAIRVPRERPSKSWWNVMAVTNDAILE